jgi:hypothetical protein
MKVNDQKEERKKERRTYQTSELRAAGETSEQAEYGNATEDDAAHQEGPERVDAARFHEGEDDEGGGKAGQYERPQHDPWGETSVCGFVINLQ